MHVCTQTHLKPRQARWAATSDAEHAVSTLAVGPRRPKAYAMRPLATEGEAAVKEKEEMGTPWLWLRLS